MRPIDVVIDDGPHTRDAIQRMLLSLLPYLADQFLYIVEDNPDTRPLLEGILSATAHVRSVGGLVVAERTA